MTIIYLILGLLAGRSLSALWSEWLGGRRWQKILREMKPSDSGGFVNLLAKTEKS